MTTFKSYRNGTSKLEVRIKEAVSHFFKDRGELPAAVVVHRTEMDDAQAAVKTLDLSLEVRGSGGCLVPEIWLQLPKEGGAVL